MAVNPTYQIAQQKLIDYCNYQERSLTEVEDKLRVYSDLTPAEVNQIIEFLIKERFLDEKRYAISFVRGKFFIKKWGKNKIAYALSSKRIPSNLIQEALADISDEEYQHTLQELILKKKAALGTLAKPIIQKKLINYLLQKGYEFELIRDNLKN